MTIDFSFLMRTTSEQSIFTDWGNSPIECKEKDELLSPVTELESTQLRRIRLSK